MQNYHTRFILSKKAGNYSKKNMISKITNIYNNHPLFDIKITESKNHATILTQEWSEKYKENALIYVGGGDGTINEVAQVLANSNSTMGILPLGTANDLAKQVYRIRNSEKYINKIIANSLNPKVKKIDLLKVNSKICINVISMGLDTVVLNEAYKYNSLGKFSYLIGVIKSLPKLQNFNLKCKYQDENGNIHSKNIITPILVLGNGGYYGSGYNPFPNALLNDAYGNFLYIDSLKLIEAICIVPKYKKGTHLQNKKVHSGLFTKFIIETYNNYDILANYDGKIFKSNKIEVEILKSGLNFAFIDISN